MSLERHLPVPTHGVTVDVKAGRASMKRQGAGSKHEQRSKLTLRADGHQPLKTARAMLRSTILDKGCLDSLSEAGYVS